MATVFAVARPISSPEDAKSPRTQIRGLFLLLIGGYFSMGLFSIPAYQVAS